MPTSEIKVIGRVKISELIGEDYPEGVFYRMNGQLVKCVRRDRGARYLSRPLLDDMAQEPARGRVLADSGNLVTTLGRQRVAELIGGLDAAFVDRIAVGDGGLFDGTSTPIPPRNDQTELVHEIIRLERKTVVVDVNVPSVTFVGVFKNVGSYQFLQPGVAQISEVGLLTSDDVLCAIYNFAPIPVDVHRLGFMIEWEWAVK